MDFMDVLFNPDKPFTPIVIAGGTTNGRVVSSDRPAYAERHLQTDALADEIEDIRQQYDNSIKTQKPSNEPGHALEDTEKFYSNFKFDRRSQSALQLPVYASKDNILQKIADFPSLVIEGSTGCGKTTQIPQMILDEAREYNRACNIVVTQPRRIAARSIAERVSAERGWELGKLVGYQIGLDKQHLSAETRITFCTTGVLLENLIQTKSLTRYTHIILDEVHERDQHMDFLMIIIRMLWAKDVPNVKIILMSATIDTAKFAEYFKFCENGRWVTAPIIKVDKKSLFSVRNYYIHEIFPQIRPEINFQKPGISEEMYKLAMMIITNMRSIDKNCSDDSPLPSVLVFLPGIHEIGTFHTRLTDLAEAKGFRWHIFILHSLISTDQQQSIFKPVDNGVRKIILSTNIAESSITVPDVKYVIDFCLTKFLKSDTCKNFTTLEIDWASKNNCRQRAGRAGRVSDGRCYRMVDRRTYDLYFKESAVPELLLAPLENVVLKAKTFEMEPPHVILGLAMDPPNLHDVSNTVLTLKELGAMHLTLRNEGFSLIDGDLTNLGRIMAGLPLNVRCTRLIVLGSCFGILEECIIMAAGLTTKSIFKITFDRNLRPYTRRLEWSNGSGSDLFALMNAYKIWTFMYNRKKFGPRPDQQKAEREFCDAHFLDKQSLSECHQLVQEIKRRLDHLGIKEGTGGNQVRYTEQEKAIFLKVVIAGAFYPNFYATAPVTNPMIERDVFHSLNGRDPERTVFFSGFRPDNIRELYVDSIRNLFRNMVVDDENLGNIKVTFDANSEKVFVTFDSSEDDYADGQTKERNDWDTRRCSLPGKTLIEVYKAVKMRQARMPTKIGVMKPEKEKIEAEKLGLGCMSGPMFILKQPVQDDIRDMCIPNATTSMVKGIVTHVDHCSKFWLQPVGEQERVEGYAHALEQEFINNNLTCCTDYTRIVRASTFVVQDTDRRLYRARLVSWRFDQATGEFNGIARFIDFGRTQKCYVNNRDHQNNCFLLNPDSELATMPPRCFQCRLAEIQPNTSNISGGHIWGSEAVNRFKQDFNLKMVQAEVYSVVRGTVNVFISNGTTSANEILIEKDFGEFAEENFLSKNNRVKRLEMQKYANFDSESASALQYSDCDEYYPIAEVETLRLHDDANYHRLVNLKGPKSPLESQVHSVLLNNEKQSITIDAHSVNSVLLTSLQQDLSIKYMVAAHVQQQGGGNNNYTIQQTTLLPSIRGFGPLMAMLFCPAMDLKRDQWKSRYISIRTGLGFDADKNCPYFVEHDAVFPLDIEFDEDDMDWINQARYSLSVMLFSFDEKKWNDAVSSTSRVQLMHKLKEVITKLLIKDRKPIEVHSVTHDWREYNDNEMQIPENMIPGKSIFPVHNIVKLQTIGREAKMLLKQHCVDLRNMLYSMPRSVLCQLCVTEIENVTMLRTHLITRLHLEREKQLGFDFDAEQSLQHSASGIY